MQKRVCALAGALLILPMAPHTAAATEYCVTCEGPPAMYRCVIDGSPEGPGKDPSVSLHCISHMAKRGGHTSCAVSRGAPFPCPGLTAVVAPPTDQPSFATPAPAEAPPPVSTPYPQSPEIAEPAEPPPAEPPPAADPPAKVPRTVEELAGQTVKSSKQGLQKAGEAIGGTAKLAGEQIGNAGTALGSAASKTWACISSLFSTCNGEPAADAAPGDPPAD